MDIGRGGRRPIADEQSTQKAAVRAGIESRVRSVMGSVQRKVVGLADRVGWPLSPWLLSAQPRSQELVHLGASVPAAVPPSSADVKFTGVVGWPYSDVQMFAVVDLADPTTALCHGVDTGDGAFTFQVGPNGLHTTFGRCSSMESALTIQNRMAGPRANLALVLFDSVPVMAAALSQGEWKVAELTAEQVAIEHRSADDPSNA